MLQGAITALLVATAVGALEIAGLISLGWPAAATAAATFVLVGAAFVAAFVATQPRRSRKRPRGAL